MLRIILALLIPYVGLFWILPFSLDEAGSLKEKLISILHLHIFFSLLFCVAGLGVYLILSGAAQIAG